MQRFLPPSLNPSGDPADAAHQAALARAKAAAAEEGYARGKSEGRDEGFAEGIVQGRAEAEAEAKAREAEQEASLLGQIHQAIRSLQQARDEDRRHHDAQVRSAIASIIKTLAPTLIERSEGAELLAITAEAMTLTKGDASSKTILIKARPEAIDQAKALGIHQDANSITFTPDPSLPIGRIIAQWDDGGMVYDAKNLTSRIIQALGSDPNEKEA